MHWTNAFPSIPRRQTHIGMCANVSQIAFSPQSPGHGSRHLLEIHALLLEQSELRTHSGRHPEYASPWYSGKQEQIPLEHWAFAPQGDGLHLSSGTSWTANKIQNCNLIYENDTIQLHTWRWGWLAAWKRISNISLKACTNGDVTIDNALCIESTRSWTRIGTFLANARAVADTILIYNAFRPTIGWWSEIVYQARARGYTIWISALCIWPAWRRQARISFNYGYISGR